MRSPLRFSLVLFMIAFSPVFGAKPTLAPAVFKEIDAAVEAALAAGEAPGAVFRMGHGKECYHQAYGNRAVRPEVEKMSADTIFDVASLTKAVATAPAVMMLVERGRLKLDDPVSRWLPEFQGDGREAVTVRQLLTHSSGMRAGLGRGWGSGRKEALQAACKEPMDSKPGTAFRYSDINFILLGLLVERVSGRSLDDFCTRLIYRPLGMKDTCFLPLGKLPVARIAPTAPVDGKHLRGVVHDPTARLMGGVSGHAGLFSSAADLGRYSEMMLGMGQLNGRRILKESTVKMMTTPQSPRGLPVRGLGWDIDSGYSGQRGELFQVGGYGHSGWTGTAMWIDPFSKTWFVFLSNRIHPSGGGNVLPLQRQLGTLAAKAVTDYEFPAAKAKEAEKAKEEEKARKAREEEAEKAAPGGPEPGDAEPVERESTPRVPAAV